MTRKRSHKARRRNPDEARKARLWLMGIAGVAVGGTVGYLVASSRAARTIAEQTGLDKWRLPDASYKAHIPDSSDDFKLLDDVICECYDPVVEAAADDATLDEVVDAIRLCVAKELHPDFEWPPAFGDHPNATQLWSELAVLVRRSVLDGRCERELPDPLPIPFPLGG